MAPRLLSLLTSIETALVQQGFAGVNQPCQRAINFHKGLARMAFYDASGSITLQSFTLADGQICVRASFAWAGTEETGTHAIYPRDAYDWSAAADQIATSWLAGRDSVKQAATAKSDASAAVSPVESVEATG